MVTQILPQRNQAYAVNIPSSCRRLVAKHRASDAVDRQLRCSEYRFASSPPDEHPSLGGGHLEVLLRLRIGDIDPAHAIVQSGHSPLDHYLHGVVHRLEEDFGNARYWFRQVPMELLQAIGHHLRSILEQEQLLDRVRPLHLFNDRQCFVPTAFVTAQENETEVGLDTLTRIGHGEWLALCYQLGIKSPALS